MSIKVQGYGWSPSLPDHRDLQADTEGLGIAKEIDPRDDYMTPIYDQLQLGSCTANTVAEAIDADRIVHGEDPFFPSRLAIYWEERKREGMPLKEDTGAYGRDGFWTARRIGLWPESKIPYTDKLNNKAYFTDPQVLAGAPTLKQERPYKGMARSEAVMKQILSNRQTIAVGFSVYESFESNEVAKSGIMPYPDRSEQIVGGHEVLIVGYLKDMPGYWLVRNHWGTEWGEKGYFFMPIKVTMNPGMSDDFRTIYSPLK